MRIAGSVVLVTGASSGIGAATAVLAARAGARLVLTGRDTARLDAVAERTGGTPVAADLTTADGVAAVARAAEAAGRVDVLVNNAGSGYAGDVADMPGDRIGPLVAANLTAPLELTRALLPAMVRRGRGHIVFVTSIAGATGVRGEAVYSAAKAGTAVFADALRQEVGRAGVGVSTVLPGIVDTPFFATRGTPYDRSTPRPVPPERVAAAILAAVERGRAETYVPGWLGLPARIRGAAPGVYRLLATRFG
jgi:short-subunit dehydrogenase